MSGRDVRFLVLGPWEVYEGDRPVSVPAGQMRVLLASLLVSVGRSVAADTLAERLWPERMPVHARATVHTYVARLRRLLGHGVIETTPGGYRLVVAPDQIDMWRFRSQIAEQGTLRPALALWRGQPFAGVDSSWLEREVVPRLREEWFAATERRIDLDLRGGHPGALVPELRDLTRQYPTRESLWLRLIDALHRSGRRAEALEAYRRVRAILIDDLGIEPGDALQRTHQRVLLDGAASSLVTATRQLPHDVAHFSGRTELARLDALRPLMAGEGRRLTHVVAIDGAPGIGKTTLAVHWAHQMAACYPDVQLYLNLRGHGPGEPVSTSSAVETLLRGLGVRNDVIPPNVDERAALLRGTLAGRRVLLLLDNARDEDQVRPLLPGGDSLVIVTSRNRLGGLSIRDGAHRVTLGPLRPREALSLLAAAFGPDRVAAERHAATRLVELCDGLPLALAIVAERAQGVGGLTEVVQALVDERVRFDVFGDMSVDGDMSVEGGAADPHADLWAALSWSYRALSEPAAAMFRMLGLHPVGDIGLDAAAALAGVPVRLARQALGQLVAAHLVREPRPQRYELHDLIRWYAGGQAARHETPAQRQAAVGRVMDWYLHATVHADVHLLPHRRRDFVAPHEPRVPPPRFLDAGAAMAWFEREYDTLRAVVSWAAENGWGGHAWRIVTAFATFFDRRIAWRDAIELHEVAVRAAEAAGERDGEGYVRNALGSMYYLKGEPDMAIAHVRRALDCFRDAANGRGETMALGNLGLMYADRGDHVAARRYAELALERCEAAGYDRGRALNLDNLGVALAAGGDHERAIACHRRAEEINREIGDANTEAMNQHHLGKAYTALRRHRDALRAFRWAASTYRRQDNRRLEALVHAEVGRTLHQAGHPALARGVWAAAVATLKEFNDPHVLEVQDAIAGIGAGTDL